MSGPRSEPRLAIAAGDLAAIRERAQRAYPEECCGILIGRRDAAGAEVVEVIAADNRREDGSRHNRYLIPPRAVLAADRRARELGLDIVGYYHSHPDHPSRPSEFDREHAWPDTSYLIVSVRQGRAVDEHSWQLSDDRSRFEPEPIDALESPPRNPGPAASEESPP